MIAIYSGLYDNFSKMVCHKKTIGFVMQSLNGSRLSIVRTDEGGIMPVFGRIAFYLSNRSGLSKAYSETKA